jgi:uncharacterized protein DUF4388
MKGNLKDFSPTQILSLVSLARKSGTLGVERKEGRAALSFKEGKLIFASVGEAEGTLASILVRDNRITKDQGAALAKRAEQTGDKQLGLLLIQKGYVTQADIIVSIKKHALAAVNAFANWKEGLFAFDTARLPGEDKITVPLDLENIIVQISRVQKLDEQLEEEIPSLDIFLKFTDRQNVKKEDLQLSKEEWRVLSFIKPENSIRMIAKSCNLNDKQIRRAVGSLREAGLIELMQIHKKQAAMSEEDKTKKRALVGRLINHLQSISTE